MSNIKMLLSDIDIDIEMLVDKDWYENQFMTDQEEHTEAGVSVYTEVLVQTVIDNLTADQLQIFMREKDRCGPTTLHDYVQMLVNFTLSDYDADYVE